ncbi:MAG: FecR domain-containing protein [Myxococcaceae bacterium]|nr:FecR domain-containing protein [Myxococcaceae bacterium]
MSYLYDKQGEGDADLLALEQRLGEAGYRPKLRARRWPVLVAAGLAVAATLAFFVAPRGTALPVTTASGGQSSLAVGRWLEPDEAATIAVADIGRVTVEPSSRVRIVETHAQRHRLELVRGALHAKVVAPPRLFVVDTPSAQAVDLGCEYDLSVEADGATKLVVTHGEVSLEGGGVSSRVSVGAQARSKKGQPPGVPRSVKAGAQVTAALDAFEQGGELAQVLEVAEAGDAVSLWNLLARVNGGAQREAVLDRLLALTGARGIDRAKVLALDAPALETLWKTFP